MLSDLFSNNMDDYKQELFWDEDHPFAEKITVHLVHHSHNDVGWLKTKEEYYHGERTDIDGFKV